MDFDYQKIKDEESRQREERVSSLQVLQPRPKPRSSIATDVPQNTRKPPIKPRCSIKCHPTTHPGSRQSHSPANQMENEGRKRIAPSEVLNPTKPLDAQTPSLQAHNLLWFQRTQLPRLPKPVPCWLHGFASRREAEQLLQDKQQGCFLLRLSESKVGFVLSYKGADKCRHFIIEEECDVSGMEGQYIIAGEDSKHCSLEELITYYTNNPVGPFNEMLTVPCGQINGICEDNANLELRNKGEGDEERAATPPTSRDNPPSDSTGSDVQASPEPVQYAVVRKALKKPHSETECMTAPDMVPHVQGKTDSGTKTEKDTPESVSGNVDMCTGGDVLHPVDAPYARVNKPQRPAQPLSTDAVSGCGASAASDSQSFPSIAATAEQKYWELEPVHTYEEAVNVRPPHNDQTDFYAIDSFANHVYSEVNLKGTEDPITASPPLQTGAAFTSARPVLPQRPAWRPNYAPIRSESSSEIFGGSAMRNPPPYQPVQSLDENSESSIYEQIPERPKSRPRLPPPHPKR